MRRLWVLRYQYTGSISASRQRLLSMSNGMPDRLKLESDMKTMLRSMQLRRPLSILPANAGSIGYILSTR
jgi:hypothetical protein